jgi:membrane-associated phospholipid phosphatase
VINIEERVGDLFEVTLANLISGSHFLTFVVSWTYWNSEFTVVGLTLLFVYGRRYVFFHRFRNWILLANTIGLVGYVALPTAPPRMFPTFGFPDTLAEFGGLNHGSGLVQLASNPYAAMPSLHAADALIVGLSMFLVCRRWWSKTIWLLWPAWVWFAVMATGNHFWLDILAGIVVAAIAGVVIYRKPLWRRLRPATAPAPA